MLQIKNLTITHKKDLRPLLEDFNFTLNTGDRAVIISEEGNGKSTLLKLIYDASLVSDYVEYTGQILTQGTLLGYLPQEFPDAWKKKPSTAIVSERLPLLIYPRRSWQLSLHSLCFPQTFLLRPALRNAFRRRKG